MLTRLKASVMAAANRNACPMPFLPSASPMFFDSAAALSSFAPLGVSGRLPLPLG